MTALTLADVERELLDIVADYWGREERIHALARRIGVQLEMEKLNAGEAA